jgi:asparagine synthase (glutamine-hydrolysing)
MCGIAGAIRPDGPGIGARAMGAMLSAIAHRGPDDEGVWSEGGAWLGHRRLSIIDLTATGRQPMISADGRLVIVLNGEIYNYRALRAEVEAAGPVAWRGTSDTEVLLEAIACFGIDGALERARGMFAFMVWDRARGRAHLARDRFGEKPLYYSTEGGGLTFASELTALERAPGLTLDLSRQALSLYFRYGYVPAPLSIYEGISKLPPGCVLTWPAEDGGHAAPRPYWSLGDLVRDGQDRRLTDPDHAVETLEGLLRQAVGDQMVADVPLGSFLSGGIDSSLITAIMQSLSDRPVKTFTLGFDVPAYNEAQYALAVARHLGADHTEHYVTAADTQAIVPQLGNLYDEPFADASQIPTFLISQMARRHVTVCLTGDGGDEMFNGYVRYPGVPRLWNAIGRLPFRGAAAKAIKALPLGLAEGTLGFLGPLAAQYASRGKLGPSLRRAAGWLPAASLAELYELTMTAWPDPDALLVDPPATPAVWRPEAPAFDDAAEGFQWRDSVDYLPGDILCKVDRAAMANGLETRVPLLDPRVAAFAWSAPPAMKRRGGESKWLLRQVLRRHLPEDLIDRPKLGFSVPLHAWLSGELREWAESLISPGRIRRQGVLRVEPLARVWRDFLAGDSSLDHRVWSVLMFQAWMAARGR